MKFIDLLSGRIALYTYVVLILIPNFLFAENDQLKTASSGELTFTIRTVTSGGTYSPKHVLAIWVEDANGFVKTRKAMANQRKQYLYTWKNASNYNVVDAITGSTLTSHQTHTVSWDCTDLDGEIVPDGDYVVWAEFTDKHSQGPLYNISFTKGPNAQYMNPADETYFKDIELTFTPYIADFSSDVTNICEFETVTYTDESVNATTWAWDFGDGAAPATSNTQGPHTIYYTTPGLKTVSLTINGSLTETKEDLITVSDNPTAEFSFSGNNLTVNFINNSLNAYDYLWDFGDGITSSEINPTHLYTSPGNFIVSLTAIYLECEDMTSMEVMVPLVGIYESSFSKNISISPNPNSGSFILITGKLGIPDKAIVYNQAGEVVWINTDFSLKNEEYRIDLNDLTQGIYFMKTYFGSDVITKKLIIK